ncbi:MAG: hypothetical protein LCH37_05030 [Bacteroidetes bacterium]|nr:hypothetical protein [Bacteroidota bacterium]
MPVLISGLGIPLMRSLHKREVKREILHELPQSALTRLAFSRFSKQEDLPEWEEEHEFFWKGQEYDVVRALEKADSIIYYAWCDEADGKLEELIRNGRDENQKQNSLTRELAKWIGFPEKDWVLSPLWFVVGLGHSISVPFSTCFLMVESPPPKSV